MELKRVFEGLSVIAVGVILLGNSTGFIPWEVWWNILQLWPLLLVAAGVDLIGKGLDNSWLRALSSLIVIGGLAYGAFAMPAGAPGLFRVPVYTTTDRGIESLRGAPFSDSASKDASVTAGTATIEGGVGRLTVRSTADALVAIDGVSTFSAPELTHSTTGNRADVSVSDVDNEGPMVPGVSSEERLDVLLQEGVDWDLTLKTGVSDTDADLRGLGISSLKLETGVSQSVISLGSGAAGPDTPVTIKSGVASVVVRLPRGAAAKVRVTSGLGGKDFADGWSKRSDGSWVTPDYMTSSANSWDITVNQGVASVRFEWL